MSTQVTDTAPQHRLVRSTGLEVEPGLGHFGKVYHLNPQNSRGSYEQHSGPQSNFTRETHMHVPLVSRGLCHSWVGVIHLMTPASNI